MTLDRSTRRGFLSSLAAVGVGISGCSAPDSTTFGARTSTPVDARETSGGTAVAEVYRTAIDSVVLVRIYGRGGDGQGSGFRFGEHVITNQHVVAGASEIEVKFNEGDWRSADVVGTDAYSDLAVLAPENRPDYAAPLSLASDAVFVGQEVLALGHPFGLASSVSSGIVSGVNRMLPAPNGFTIPAAVQTTAAVNPGNSGGPLVTMDGDVAGVVTSGTGDNVGFAVGVPLVRRVVPALVEAGAYRHPYVGVRLVEVTPLVADPNDLAEPTGVLVASVVSGGPADGVLAGSESTETRRGQEIPVGGDAIVAIDGRSIPSLGALSTYLTLEASPGDELDMMVIREGERRTLALTLGTRPPPA